MEVYLGRGQDCGRLLRVYLQDGSTSCLYQAIMRLQIADIVKLGVSGDSASTLKNPTEALQSVNAGCRADQGVQTMNVEGIMQVMRWTADRSVEPQ